MNLPCIIFITRAGLLLTQHTHLVKNILSLSPEINTTLCFYVLCFSMDFYIFFAYLFPEWYSAYLCSFYHKLLDIDCTSLKEICKPERNMQENLYKKHTKLFSFHLEIKSVFIETMWQKLGNQFFNIYIWLICLSTGQKYQRGKKNLSYLSIYLKI